MSSELPKEQLAVVFNKDLEKEVTTLPVLEPEDNQILFKTKAFSTGTTNLPAVPQNIGAILGFDASGIVVRVGKDVKGFKPGDQVCAFFHGGFEPFPYPGPFAQYVHSKQHTTYKFNYELGTTDKPFVEAGPVTTFESATTLSMSLGTVGTSFYYSFKFRKGQDYSDKVLLIWSAGSAVGSMAVQIAKWLGFGTIVVTASKSKHDFLTQLGADAVFDYNDAEVVQQIKAQYGEEITYGLDCRSTSESLSATYSTLSNTKPAFIDNLLSKTESDLENVQKKTNEVSFYACSLFLAIGDEMNFFGRHIPVLPGIVEALSQFQQDVQPLIDSKSLIVQPFEKIENGLYGMVNASFKPRVPNYKIVGREVETKKF